METVGKARLLGDRCNEGIRCTCCRLPSGKARKRLRRSIKRGERNTWRNSREG